MEMMIGLQAIPPISSMIQLTVLAVGLECHMIIKYVEACGNCGDRT